MSDVENRELRRLIGGIDGVLAAIERHGGDARPVREVLGAQIDAARAAFEWTPAASPVAGSILDAVVAGKDPAALREVQKGAAETLVRDMHERVLTLAVERFSDAVTDRMDVLDEAFSVAYNVSVTAPAVASHETLTAAGIDADEDPRNAMGSAEVAAAFAQMLAVDKAHAELLQALIILRAGVSGAASRPGLLEWCDVPTPADVNAAPRDLTPWRALDRGWSIGWVTDRGAARTAALGQLDVDREAQFVEDKKERGRKNLRDHGFDPDTGERVDR